MGAGRELCPCVAPALGSWGLGQAHLPSCQGAALTLPRGPPAAWSCGPRLDARGQRCLPVTPTKPLCYLLTVRKRGPVVEGGDFGLVCISGSVVPVGGHELQERGWVRALRAEVGDSQTPLVPRTRPAAEAGLLEGPASLQKGAWRGSGGAHARDTPSQSHVAWLVHVVT